MQIVIELDDKTYNTLFPKELTEMSNKKAVYWLLKLHSAVCKGTVLPKGHGRIVDIDNAVKDLESFSESFCVFHARGHGAKVDYTGEVLIEADKEEGKNDV